MHYGFCQRKAFQAGKIGSLFAKNISRGSFAALVEEPSSATRVRHLLSTVPLEFYKESCFPNYEYSEIKQKKNIKIMKLFAAVLALVNANALDERLAIISGHVGVSYREILEWKKIKKKFFF
jgi:hypothetical protein